jgi:hypothetical protein
VHRQQSRRPGAQSPCWLPMRWPGSVPRSWRTSRTPGRMSSTVLKTALAGMTSDGTSKVRGTRHNRIWSGRFRLRVSAEGLGTLGDARIHHRCDRAGRTNTALLRNAVANRVNADWLRDAF